MTENSKETEVVIDEQETGVEQPPESETLAPEDTGTETDTSEQQAGPDEADTGSLEQEIESLRRQVDANLDKALRAQAEVENLRKRAGRDIENAHKYALDKFIKELLPVLDSMELGITASDENVESIESLREGMDLTLKKFLDTMNKFGVEAIDPLHEKFNPERHQAVTMQEVEGVESGAVTAVMQKGYILNGRLVRPAMVIVAK